MLTDWLRKRPTALKYCYQIDQYLLSDFLEHILIDRESSARTRNNYLGWLSSFCSWMMSKGYLKENPTAKIPKLKEEPKKRNALSAQEIKQLSAYLAKTNKHYLLACLFEYYTFIRPIELAQIKLEHISIADQKVFVPGAISKNKKDGMVGLNDTIIKLMIELRVFDHPGNCFLFGNGFRPSEKQAEGRIFRDYFMKLRAVLGWDDTKQFYSLKDSGIRDLANAEGIVVARDQARHSDISTTNKYLKGDNLTVHEETKHFKGAFGGEKARPADEVQGTCEHSDASVSGSAAVKMKDAGPQNKIAIAKEAPPSSSDARPDGAQPASADPEKPEAGAAPPLPKKHKPSNFDNLLSLHAPKKRKRARIVTAEKIYSVNDQYATKLPTGRRARDVERHTTS